MKNLWIEITVEIRDKSYSYNTNKGEGKIEFTFPEDMIDQLDFGNLIDTLKKSALSEYKNNLVPKPEENEEN